MTNLQKLQSVRDKIIKIIPEIIDLKFGCVVENGWASQGNCCRTGIFVNKVTRSGVLNPGKFLKVTNGKRLWLMNMNGDHKIKIIGRKITLEELFR